MKERITHFFRYYVQKEFKMKRCEGGTHSGDQGLVIRKQWLSVFVVGKQWLSVIEVGT